MSHSDLKSKLEFKQLINNLPNCQYKVGSRDVNASWDCSIISGNTSGEKAYMIVEIKDKKEASTKWPNGFVEKHKYDGLEKIRKEMKEDKGIDCSIVFVTFYRTDNMMYLWVIDDIAETHEIKMMYLPTTTEETYFEAGWKYGPTYWLPRTNANLIIDLNK